MFNILEDGVEPKIKTKNSSSADLCSRAEVLIRAGETKVVPLGVTINLEEVRELTHNRDKTDEEWDEFLRSHFFELKLRSSVSFKLIIANGTGEIDIDYPKEIGLIAHNPLRLKYSEDGSAEIDKDNHVLIKKNEPVAQIKLMPHKNNFMPNRYRSEEERKGGYGSTNS